ncbi:MAG: hypothetical protein C3F07_10030 [Anaerolineales bacterium]|nr:MAG: hypothetical protein C3F07_10030 [Anaerolineales bacterium]
MNAFTNYLEKLGSNFLVASMVPSLTFVVASILVFDPTLTILAAFKDIEEIPRLIILGLLVSIFTVIIGFTLTALNTFILKMFEGYVKPFPVYIAYYLSQKKHLRKARALMEQRDLLESRIRELKKQVKHDPRWQSELDELSEQHYMVAAEYGLTYPEDLKDVMPSRFGNTLKAAENYPGERYGFDGVHIWPRLVDVIPTEYKLSIDSTRNELSFLVNMSILSATFALLCVLAFFLSMGGVSGAGTNPKVFLDFLPVIGKFILLAGVGITCCYFFYNASIFSVGSFGLMIRSSFDLFRLDLLKKLGVERPKDSIQEFETWNSLNELIVLGRHSLSFRKLDYREKE